MKQNNPYDIKKFSIWIRLPMVAVVVNLPLVLLYLNLDGSLHHDNAFMFTSAIYGVILTPLALWLYAAKHQNKIHNLVAESS